MMHQAGEEIIAEGYKHVVTISNYHDENNVFQTPSILFIEAMEFKLHSEDKPRNSVTSPMIYYKGFECKWTIQDGELQGAGIYVFFKNKTGANICEHDFLKL